MRGQHNAPSQLSRGEIINEISSCLALVKPVGMSDDMATEWLAVAAGELLDLTRNALKAGCAHARRTCTHHAQIVPTVLAEAALVTRQTPSKSFGEDWQRATNAFLEAKYPELARHKLESKTDVQALIEATANDLTRR